MPAAEAQTQRLFFALSPPSALRARMAECAYAVNGGRPVAAANLHMTLAFLGDCDAGARVWALTAARVLATPSPFQLRLDRLALNRRRGLLYLAPSQAHGGLEALAGSLRRALQAYGLGRERRPFRAHVTLARRVPAQELTAPPCLDWPVAAFRLLASVPLGGGVRYRCLAQWPLRGEASERAGFRGGR